MKKLIVLIICIFSLNAIARDMGSNSGNNPPHAKYKYCASMHEGKLVIKNEGKVITTDAMLDNGVTVTTDGYVVMKDGTRKQIKNGQCVTSDGSIMTPEKKSTKPKK